MITTRRRNKVRYVRCEGVAEGENKTQEKDVPTVGFLIIPLLLFFRYWLHTIHHTPKNRDELKQSIFFIFHSASDFSPDSSGVEGGVWCFWKLFIRKWISPSFTPFSSVFFLCGSVQSFKTAGVCVRKNTCCVCGGEVWCFEGGVYPGWGGLHQCNSLPDQCNSHPV